MGLVLSGVLGIVGCRGSTEKNQAPLWNESTAWTVGPELLRIGANDALPGHSLFRVRMAIADPDGRVLVADGGTNEVRIFDASGTLVATLGGSGQGPAEFRMLSAIWLAFWRHACDIRRWFGEAAGLAPGRRYSGGP